LAVPLFLRGTDKGGKEFLDFTAAINVSAGGALVISRHPLSRSAKLTIEIPSVPLPQAALPPPVRHLKARVVRSAPKEVYNIYALRFSRPLV
jgi:hypothetical protein